MSIKQNELQKALISERYPLLLNPLSQNRISLSFLGKFRDRQLETKELEELNVLNEEELREFTKFAQAIHIEKFSKSEMEHIAISQFNLGKYFQYVAKKQKLESALEWYLSAANNDFAEAQNKVGEFLEFNFGLSAYPMQSDQNQMTRSARMKLAFSWYKKAKENNQLSVDAYYNFGRCNYFFQFNSKKLQLKLDENERLNCIRETVGLFDFAKKHGHKMAEHYSEICSSFNFRFNLKYTKYLSNFIKSKERLSKYRAENPGLKPRIDDDLIFHPWIDKRYLDGDQHQVFSSRKKLDGYLNELLFYTFKFYEKEAEFGNQLAMVRLGHFYRKGIKTAKLDIKKSLKQAYKYYLRAADLLSPEGVYWLIKIQIDNPNVEFAQNQSRIEWQLSNIRRLEESGIPRNSHVLALFEQLDGRNIARLIEPRSLDLDPEFQNPEQRAQHLNHELHNHRKENLNNGHENMNNRFSMLLKACTNEVPKAAFKFWLFLVENPHERRKLNKKHSDFLEMACNEEDGDALYYLAMQFLRRSLERSKPSCSTNPYDLCHRKYRGVCHSPVHVVQDYEDQITWNLLNDFVVDSGLYEENITEQFRRYILSKSILNLLKQAANFGSQAAQKQLVQYLLIKASMNVQVYRTSPLRQHYVPKEWYRESLYWLRSYHVEGEDIKIFFIEGSQFLPPALVNIILSYLEDPEAANQQKLCEKHLMEELMVEEQYLAGLTNAVLENNFLALHKFKNLFDPLEYRQIRAITKTELKAMFMLPAEQIKALYMLPSKPGEKSLPQTQISGLSLGPGLQQEQSSARNVGLSLLWSAVKGDLLLNNEYYEKMVIPLVHAEITRIDMLISTIPLPKILIFVITAYERGFSCVSSVKKGFDLQLIQRQLEEEAKSKMELDEILNAQRKLPITFLSQDSHARFPSFEPESENEDEFEEDLSLSKKRPQRHRI